MIVAAASVQAQMPAEATLPERVLWVLAQEERPLGVYEIARRLVLSTERTHHSNSIYRVLDTLMSQRRVLSVASTRAWMLDRHPDAGVTIVLLCEGCGAASQIEAKNIDAILSRLVTEQHFTPRRHHIEVLGRCRKCRAQGCNH